MSFDFLKDLSEAYRLTGDKKYLEKAKELIVDFARDNHDPDHLPSEFSWGDHSATLRGIFLVDFWGLWIKEGIEDNAFTSLSIELIWSHAEFLALKDDYARKYNHGMFNALAVFRISVAFPEFRSSREWIQLAIDRMEQQARENFSSDGVEKEYSPSYQVLTAKLM